MRKKTIYFLFFVLVSGLAAEFQPGDFYANGPRDKNQIALTFDDGPGPHTLKFLALLKKYNVKATFFMQGDQVRIRPKIARQVAEDGHEIGSHTWNHRNYKKRLREIKKAQEAEGKDLTQAETLLKAELKADFEKTVSKIEKETGVRPRVLRMPYGVDRPWVNAVAKEVGFVLVNWTYGADWSKETVEALTKGYVRAMKPGAILLLHDGGGNREKSLVLTEAVLKAAQEKDIQIVSLETLLAL